MKNIKVKFFALFISVLIILASLPFAAVAAPALDIPSEMLDNAYMRALAYTGYNVQSQKNDGTIFKVYSSNVPATVRSAIGYGTNCYGNETIANTATKTGLAPNIQLFESSGLCCASYVSYIYYNYLPNIEGINTFGTISPVNLRSAEAYNTVANSWVTSNKARRINFTQINGDLNTEEKIPLGSLITFKNSAGYIKHVAVYIGEYGGNHFITHVGNSNGPEICTINGMTKGSSPQTVNQIVAPAFVEPTGSIEVIKTDTNGNALAGAFFVATLNSDPSKQYLIGPTDSSGYGKTAGNIPYGSYTVKETVFPENHRAYGQTVWNISVNDSNKGVAKFSAVNELIPGAIQIVKTSEDSKVKGVKFNIIGEETDTTVLTDENGTVLIDNLKPGVYTVSEVESENYILLDSQLVTVVSGQTSTLYFNNQLRKGNLKIMKTAEDDFVEGLEFGLFGISLSGESISMYAVSDSNGNAEFIDIPIGQYKVYELNTPDRYTEPQEIDVVINWNETTSVSIHNILKKWNAEIYKTDAESGIGSHGQIQGDSTLQGAVYGLYKDGVLIKEYTTDANGYILTDYYPCENGYYIKEISPSTGYLIDNTAYYIDLYTNEFIVEYNTVSIDCKETVKKSNIMLIKHCDDGSTQIETPEDGAEFEVFLKFSGSYENAKSTERDYLITNKDGIAISKSLPYGLYTVKQIKGKDGYEIMPDFDVFISDNAEIYSYIINDAPLKSYIDIIKKDATTNKQIPVSGIGFKVRDLSTNEYIKQHINYPNSMDIDVFYTDSSGKLRLPERLSCGEYELIEQSAALGYVLDSIPVKFTVDGTSDLVTIEKLNDPQMGIIKIFKEGEVLSSVEKNERFYIPIYDIHPLEGSVFSIYAAEDIYTLDGTLRNRKGDKITTVKTGEDGFATTMPLFLGKYEIREEEAPLGMMVLKEPIYTQLVYAGQEVKITTECINIKNNRQKVIISLIKELEVDERFSFGIANEYEDVRFGLFAKEDIVAKDSSVIPKDTLIEVISIDETGKGIFEADMPFGAKLYVKEIEINEGYVLSNKMFPIEISSDARDLAVVQLVINNGEVIKNNIIRAIISGIKTDENKNPIKNVIFGLFRSDETEFTIDKALIVAETDEKGCFKFENVPYGNWLIKELDCPVQYVMDEMIYKVEVIKNGDEFNFEFVNKTVSGNIKLIKLNKADLKARLTGAEFELYYDSDEDGVFNPMFDTCIGTLSETESGVYEYFGLKYGGYFLYESKAPNNFKKDDTYYYFKITEEGQQINIENEKGVGFVNEPIPGNDKVISPQTGDSTKLTIFIIAAFFSMITVVALIFIRKRIN